MPLALFIFLRIVLATQGLLWLQINFRIVSSTSIQKRHWNHGWDCIESVDGFGYENVKY